MASMKILMLHGYTQNGTLFHAKTRVLEKHLQKVFPGVVFSYPTGPLGLRRDDIPGVDTSASNPDDIEAYGWWRRSNTSDPPEYLGLDTGLQKVADIMSADGPFDGVIGFSQGAALAAMISSLLEGTTRRNAFLQVQKKSSQAIPYPSSFESLQHPPLKFCVPYCGFIAPGERYEAFYNPSIKTPSCHFIGSLDSVVEESRTQALIDAFGGVGHVQVVAHPGGHFVPSGKQYLDIVAQFIKATMSPELKKLPAAEEKAEDMDLPF
jgi:Serine hydrolase (FSH1)